MDFSEFPEVSTKKAFDADLPVAIAGASAGEPLSMIFVDVDDLKAMNTSFTNPRVNKALAALAGLLARVSRGKGKAYRYGGDEFAVLLPNTGLDEAVSTAERICHSNSQ